MLRFATQDKDFFPRDPAAKLSAASELGFEGFEIDGKLLVDEFSSVRAASRASGVPVVSVCGGYRGWIGDFDRERRRTALGDISAILERAGELGAAGIVVPAAWGMFSRRLPPMVPPRDEAGDRAVLLDSLGVLDAAAARTGTWIQLEALNRYEDHMLNTLRAAADLIDAGGFSRVVLMPDCYHMNIEEARIEESLAAYAGRFRQLHVASSQRIQPGAGHIDYAAVFGALKRSGFDGWAVFECRVAAEDPAAAYRASLSYLRGLREAAGFR